MRNFDEQRHKEIEDRWRRFTSGPSNTAQKPLDREFVLSWSGLKFRYVSADAHSLQLRDLWLKHGNSPAEEHVYQQDKELTEFHVAALSCIETGCYALYMIAARFNPELFPSGYVRTLRDASPRSCERQLATTLANSSMQQFFTSLVKDADFNEISEIRNVSGYRMALSRNMYSRSFETELILPNKSLPLDGQFTEIRMPWLSQRVAEMMNVADFTLRTYGA